MNLVKFNKLVRDRERDLRGPRDERETEGFGCVYEESVDKAVIEEDSLRV